jgi:hypothetical protein
MEMLENCGIMAQWLAIACFHKSGVPPANEARHAIVDG